MKFGGMMNLPKVWMAHLCKHFLSQTQSLILKVSNFDTFEMKKKTQEH